MRPRPSFGLPRLTGTVRQLLVGLVAAYVLQLVLENWLALPIVSLLALTPGSPWLWQLVTYALVHPEHPLMFLLGLLFIWWALSPLEMGFGATRTWQLCLAAVLGGSLPAYAVGLVVPGSPPLYGSQTIWFGGIAAMTWTFKDRQMSFFGVMPMTAKQFLVLLVGLSFLMFLASKNHTHFVADLGAMAAGVGFVRWMRRPRTVKRIPRAKPARGLRVIEGGGEGDGDRPKWLN